MRLTTLLLTLAGVTTTGCVATVGGNECTSERCTGEGSGSNTPAAANCEGKTPEVVQEPVTISETADFAGLPTGCWKLDNTLRIEGPAITSLAKLGNLLDVNDLELVDTGLTEIDSKQLIKVYGSLLVSGNAKLTKLDADKLRIKRWDGETTGGEFSVAYVVRNNPVLASVTALKYAVQVDRELTVTNNPALATFEMPDLTRVGGALTISGTALTTLSFATLATVGGIDISTNSALTSVTGLATTTILGNLTLRGNPRLASLGAMNALAQISGNLVVDDNDALTDLAGLTGSMQRIGGTVTISGNAALTSLGQLSHLTQGIGATVSITDNPTLGYCKAVEVDHCVQSGQVTITGNLNQNNCNCWCGR